MTKGKVFSGRVIFDHRPKTAGTALRVWLENTLGTASVVHVTADSHRNLIAMYGGSYPVICSHVSFSKEGERLDPRYQYMTCLRDPVDRAVSWLYFALNTIPHDFVGPLGRGVDIKKMARTVIESEGREIPDRVLEAHTNIYVKHFSKIVTDEVPPPQSDFVARALAAVKNYDVVGLYSDMPGFLSDVAGLLGIQAPRQIERKNVTSARPEKNAVSAIFRERLAEANALDIAFLERVSLWKKRRDAEKVVSTPQAERRQVFIRFDKPESKKDTPALSLGSVVMRQGRHLGYGETAELEIDFYLNRDVNDLKLSLKIFDAYERLAYATDTAMQGSTLSALGRGAHRAAFALRADLPAGEYRIAALFHEAAEPGECHLLGQHDDLCRFNVLPQAAPVFKGYSDLYARISVAPLDVERKDITNGKGRIIVVSPLPKFVSLGEEKGIPVEIQNDSAQDWAGDPFRPLHLSYHLLTLQGEPIIFDGIRSQLPEEGIPAGEKVGTVMLVSTPVPPGRYRLAPSLVQEDVCWFEAIGMDVETVDIEVV